VEVAGDDGGVAAAGVVGDAHVAAVGGVIVAAAPGVGGGGAAAEVGAGGAAAGAVPLPGMPDLVGRNDYKGPELSHGSARA
jgi:hypothetical protein